MPKEKFYPLIPAIQEVTGRRPHLSTALRWCQRNNRHGVRLESWVVGGRRVTSVEAVRRYVEATTAAADGQAPKTVIAPPVRLAHRNAMNELNDLGI